MVSTGSSLENSLRGNNYEWKRARLDDHAHDRYAHPDLHPSRMLSKNLKKHRSYAAHKNMSMKRWIDGRQNDSISSKPFGLG